MVEPILLGIVALATCVTAGLVVYERLKDKPDVQIVRVLTRGKAEKASDNVWHAQIAVVVANTGSRDALGCVAAFRFPGGVDGPLIKEDWARHQQEPRYRDFDLPSHSQTALISHIKGDRVPLRVGSGILEVAVHIPAKIIEKSFHFGVDDESDSESWVTFTPTG